MPIESHFNSLRSYSDLGYDVTLIRIYGKDGIRMRKRYSHVREKEVICEQVWNHDRLEDLDEFNDFLDKLYNNIKEQEETGKYQSSILDD